MSPDAARLRELLRRLDSPHRSRDLRRALGLSRRAYALAWKEITGC